MSAAFTYRQKMDISCCGDKTGFPRPSHKYKDAYVCSVVLFSLSSPFSVTHFLFYYAANDVAILAMLFSMYISDITLTS